MIFGLRKTAQKKKYPLLSGFFGEKKDAYKTLLLTTHQEINLDI